MLSQLESEDALVRGLWWLEGLEPSSNLAETISSWYYLPTLADANRDRRLACRYFIEDLARVSSAASTGLHLAARHAASGNWICGIRKLAWDSYHFGFGIGQIDPLISPPASQIDADTVAEGVELVKRCLDHALKQELAYLGAIVDSADSMSQLCLSRCGFSIADTLLTHRLDLELLPPLDDEPNVRPARESDLEQLEAISAECFGNRLYNANRFNGDPIFPAHKVRELYRLFVGNSYARKLADQVLVYEHQGQPLGFITLAMPKPMEQERGLEVGHVPINAVHPEYHGRGIYSALVRAALKWFQDGRVKSVDIKTQLPNLAVHRAWHKLGARVWTSVHRFRFSTAGPQ